ncbi:MAG: YeeE/YedE family protein [Myxococcales bacterium]|nr:YeeE/YedE family protein [Myxococcales bacterium]
MDRTLVAGAAFGFVLSRAGATEYDAIAGMFRLTDLHLFGVIGVAVAVTALGFTLFRKGLLRTFDHQPAALVAKPWKTSVVWGGLLFGAGWAVAGTCPGTALAQIGEGRLAGLFTLAGILLGAYLDGRREAFLAQRGPAARLRPAQAHT